MPKSNLPPQQHRPTPIVYSYLDPSPPVPGRSTQGEGMGDDGSKLPDPSGFLFPNLLPSLAPGRRGAWILPLSGPLPWSTGKPTPPVWPGSSTVSLAAPAGLHPSSSGASLAPPSSATAPTARASKPRRIEWTDVRLRATWFWLDRLHAKGLLGPVSAACFTSREMGGTMPDHIRVYGLAHLALALRATLMLVDVRSTGWEGEEDTGRFLDRVRLVWVDEAGRPVMVA